MQSTSTTTVSSCPSCAAPASSPRSGSPRRSARQIEKAKAGKLSADDLSGGTYSISNNGAFGTTFTAPIINAPQVGILSTDAIRLKPAVVSTPEGDFLAPRMIGIIGQSFDHRAFDGAYSAAFLSRLKADPRDAQLGRRVSVRSLSGRRVVEGKSSRKDP